MKEIAPAPPSCMMTSASFHSFSSLSLSLSPSPSLSLPLSLVFPSLPLSLVFPSLPLSLVFPSLPLTRLSLCFLVFSGAEELQVANLHIKAFDLGGHHAARQLWSTYFPSVNAIIYLVDAVDRERFPESKAALDVSFPVFFAARPSPERRGAFPADQVAHLRRHLHRTSARGSLSLPCLGSL